MTQVFTIVLGLMAAAAAFMIIRGLLVPAQSDSEMLETRLAQFAESGHVISSLSEAELSLPFFERVIQPIFDGIGRVFSSRMSASNSQRLTERINLAGRPGGLSAGGFQAIRLIFIIAGTVIGLGLGTLLGGGTDLILSTAILFLVAFIGPRTWLDRKVRARKKEILTGLPSALDLLTISVEAGLGFDAALSRVTEKYKNALSLEFNQLLNEVRLGRPRLEAMDEMGRRCDVEELTNFVQAIIQSEQLGVGVANVLRIQSEEIRRRRRQRAEEAGQKAPLKMLFPMVGCIFPTLFIVLLGPAALEVMKAF